MSKLEVLDDEGRQAGLPIIPSDQLGVFLCQNRMFGSLQGGGNLVSDNRGDGGITGSRAALRRGLLYFDTALAVETVRGGLSSFMTEEERLAASTGHLQTLTLRAHGRDGIDKFHNANLLAFEALRDSSGSNIVAASSLQNFEKKWLGHYRPGMHWQLLDGFPIVAEDADLEKIIEFKSEYGAQLKKLNDDLTGKVELIYGSEMRASTMAQTQKEIADELARLRNLFDQKGIAYRIGGIRISLEAGELLPHILNSEGLVDFFGSLNDTGSLITGTGLAVARLLPSYLKVTHTNKQLATSPFEYAMYVENRFH